MIKYILLLLTMITLLACDDSVAVSDNNGRRLGLMYLASEEEEKKPPVPPIEEPTPVEKLDTDGDGLSDAKDKDDDGDGIDDITDPYPKGQDRLAEEGMPDGLWAGEGDSDTRIDRDEDGIVDEDDQYPDDPTNTPPPPLPDKDDDGIPDEDDNIDNRDPMQSWTEKLGDTFVTRLDANYDKTHYFDYTSLVEDGTDIFRRIAVIATYSNQQGYMEFIGTYELSYRNWSWFWKLFADYAEDTASAYFDNGSVPNLLDAYAYTAAAPSISSVDNVDIRVEYYPNADNGSIIPYNSDGNVGNNGSGTVFKYFYSDTGSAGYGNTTVRLKKYEVWLNGAKVEEVND